MRFWSRALGLVLVGSVGFLGPAGSAWATSPTTPMDSASVAAKKVSPKKWVHAVCVSLGDWERQIKDLGRSVETNLRGVSDLSQAKDELVRFMSDAVGATDKLLARLRKAGVANADNGDKIARVFKTGFTDARDVFAKARDAAGDLNTSDPTLFQASAADLTAALGRGSDAIGKTFDTAKHKYKLPALDRAFKADRSCGALRS